MSAGSKVHSVCIELQGKERDDLLAGRGEFKERYWLQVDDEDHLVLAAVEAKVGDKAGGGQRMVRLHAPMQTNLREVVSDKKFEKLVPAPPVDWSMKSIVSDLVDLDELALIDGCVMHTLRMRFHGEDAIYTAIGDVLLAVNPFRPVPCCTERAINDFMTFDIPSIPPHIVKTARLAYMGMAEGGSAQAILVSGESGAGKTEQAKLCLRCIAGASNSSGKAIDAALSSNPVLEAFGNATTVHNKNSSRFGKWLSIYFDDKGRVASTNVRHFLLEQSRVPGPPPAERNYHAFYYLLHGGKKELPAGMPGGDITKYEYTKAKQRVDGGKEPPKPTPEMDASEWPLLMTSMGEVGFSKTEIADVTRYLAAILALGNVGFKDKPNSGSECVDGGAALAISSTLFKVDSKQLERKITTRQMVVGTENVTVEHTAAQAIDARDALAKAAYMSLFSWIVEKINDALKAQTTSAPNEEMMIGLLDIFGFENFRMNSFEQLCINLTNERLQGIFMDALVKRQLAEYQREGIEFSHITYPDNTKQLTLLDGKSNSVMSLLDEECRVPNGSEAAYVRKMNDRFKGSEVYSPPKRGAGAVGVELSDKKFDDLQFVITHYAGPVRYTAYEWLEKNRGMLPPELHTVMSTSACPLTVTLFPCLDPIGLGGGTDASKKTTLGGHFRASLRALSATILESTQHFVRCIKPNPLQQAAVFDGSYIQKQLAYAGVKSVVEINQRGYPVSFTHETFIRRYRALAFHKPKEIAKGLPPPVVAKNLFLIAEKAVESKKNKVAAATWTKDKEAQVGKTKVFTRGHVRRAMEKLRTAAFTRAAICVQRRARERILVRVMAFLEPQEPFMIKAREAILDRNPDPAVEALDELSVHWATNGIPAGLHPQLTKVRAEIDELEAMLLALQQGLAAERVALLELEAAHQLAATSSSPREAFLGIKMAVRNAREVARGFLDELRPAIVEAETLLEKKFGELVEEWERELSAKVAALEEERRKKVAVEEARLRTDAQMELLTIEIKKQPAKGAPAKGVSFKPEEEAGPPPNAVHGIHFNESNAIVRIEATSPNAPSAKAEPSSRLRVGDAVLDVCAEALDGHKVVKSLNEIEEAAPDAKLTLTVARPKYAREANALPTGDHVGWLYASLATDKCGKAIGEGRASRYWVALQADTLLIVSPREGGGAGKLGDITGALKTAEKSKVGANKGVMGTTKQLVGGGTAKNLVEKQGGGDGGPPVHPILGRDTEVGEREVKIRGATAKAFMTQSIKLGAGGEKVALPAVAQSLVDRKLYPLRLSWADGETEGIDLVLAAASVAERKGWVNALTQAIKAHKVDTGTSGWLVKKGGRKGGLLSKVGLSSEWKRRWMTLPPLADHLDPHERVLSYQESPDSRDAKGTIAINKNTKLLRSPQLYTDQPYCFTITSQGLDDEKPLTTTLAAQSAEDLEKWVETIDEAVRGCVYADNGVALRTPQMKKDEAELMLKTPRQLQDLLAYLNAPVADDLVDKGVLAARIVATRLHVLAGGGKGAGALAAKDKAARDALRARAAAAKREEFRLLARSVEELHQLVEFLEIQNVDPSIDDKPTLVKLITAEKKLTKMTHKHAGSLMGWRIRSSGSKADVRGMAISITERAVSGMM